MTPEALTGEQTVSALVSRFKVKALHAKSGELTVTSDFLSEGLKPQIGK